MKGEDMVTRNNRVVDDIYNSKRYPRLYRIWANAKYRCNNPNANNYKYYGGRGIDFYKGWEKFAPFCKWALANGYNDELTLDRVDVDKGYSPQNCRWISVMEQENNRTNNTNYTFDGETHTLAEWCRIYGLNYGTVLNRYANGKRGDELFRPTGKIREEDEFEDIRYSDSTLRCWTKNKLILYINKLYEVAEQMKGR